MEKCHKHAPGLPRYHHRGYTVCQKAETIYDAVWDEHGSTGIEGRYAVEGQRQTSQHPQNWQDKYSAHTRGTVWEKGVGAPENYAVSQ